MVTWNKRSSETHGEVKCGFGSIVSWSDGKSTLGWSVGSRKVETSWSKGWTEKTKRFHVYKATLRWMVT